MELEGAIVDFLPILAVQDSRVAPALNQSAGTACSAVGPCAEAVLLQTPRSGCMQAVIC